VTRDFTTHKRLALGRRYEARPTKRPLSKPQDGDWLFIKPDRKLGIWEMHYGESKGAMSMPENLHGYHVHIYFDDTTKARAIELHDTLVGQFKAQPSRPQFIGIAGPHPIPQMQAIFPKDAFTADVVPWLMFNRQGLDILIHPLTDDEVEDHTAHAVWLGKPVELLTDKLKHGPTIPELMPTPN
jgi:aromatic ring-cleaving dioxygenase